MIDDKMIQRETLRETLPVIILTVFVLAIICAVGLVLEIHLVIALSAGGIGGAVIWYITQWLLTR